MTQFEKKTIAPLGLLERTTREMPGIWDSVEAIHAEREDADGLPLWPAWCYAPLQAIAPITTARMKATAPSHHVASIALRVHALAAWRMGMHCLRIDPELEQSLTDTPITGDIPHEVLLRLPTWGLYIELAKHPRWHGAFAHLDFAMDTRRPELRILLFDDRGQRALAVPLAKMSLREAIAAMYNEAAQMAQQAGIQAPEAHADLWVAEATPIINILLYILSQEPDITAITRRSGEWPPANPAPIPTKKGPRLFAAGQCSWWMVGRHLGASLREARQAQSSSTSPAPHIRRAHWHGFWSGPMAGPRRYELKWLPPIPVNFG